MICFRQPETLQERLQRMQQEALPYIEKFCLEKDIKLLNITTTHESGTIEPMYLFSDNLGGYTLEGIQNSLAE